MHQGQAAKTIRSFVFFLYFFLFGWVEPQYLSVIEIAWSVIENWAEKKRKVVKPITLKSINNFGKVSRQRRTRITSFIRDGCRLHIQDAYKR